MKMPICDTCLRSNTLCKVCKEKLKKEEITNLDIELARTLYNINRNYNLGDITFKKSVESGGLIVMIVGKGDVGSVIGKGGKIIRILRRKFNKRIRVIGDTDDLKNLVDELIYPARISGIDIVYPVSGEIINRIRIDKISKDKMPAEISIVENVIRKITKKNIKTVFE
ncbi:MAG: transcription elongation factor NusA [Methanomicrobia archaeon]|nr:transcription elongation factor NusA [Methanomicrobia archaeon]MCK4636566.1 transcription elongation factor NusA [Methanomicrobia archaeon]